MCKSKGILKLTLIVFIVSLMKIALYCIPLRVQIAMEPNMPNTLLLGAGFSFDLGMPIGNELTDIFLDFFTSDTIEEFIAVLAPLQPYGKDRPINSRAIQKGFGLILKHKDLDDKNYEKLLSNLEEKTKPSINQSDVDSYHLILDILYQLIYDILTIHQIESYKVMYQKNYKLYSNIVNLLNDGITWVTTLNHDVFLECIAIDLGLPVSYGQTRTMSFPVSNLEMHRKIFFECYNRSDYRKTSSGFMESGKGINLVKLHGGLGEFEYDDGNVICNMNTKREKSSDLIGDFLLSCRLAYYQNGIPYRNGKDAFVTNNSGEFDILHRAVLTGGNKYSITNTPKANEGKLTLFSEILNDSDLLTIIGYGFGDKHVNVKISNAMLLNKKLKIWIVDPSHKAIPEFLEQFDYNSRVRRAMCSATEWMYHFKYEKWDYAISEEIGKNHIYRDEICQNVRRRLGLNNEL